MAPRGKASEPAWLPAVLDAYAVHNVLATRPELPFYLVRWDGGRALEWMDLSDPRPQIRPFHFEIHFGKERQRDEHYLEALAAAARRRAPVARALFGFWDLFHPVAEADGARWFVFAGQFLRQEPTWASVCAQWRELTGLEPASANVDFVHFVRMTLALPVLEAPLFDGYQRFAVLLGRQLTGRGKPHELQAAIDEVNREVISRYWPIEHWVDSAIHPDKFHLTPWNLEGGKLTDWMKEGMGLSRLPTTVLALMPLDDRAQAVDRVQTLVRNAAIQRACIALARDMPETAATRLGDYGVAIITSSRPGKNAVRQRLELRERAQRFQAAVWERFRVRALVGIGSPEPPGAPLFGSHREAVLALHMAVQLEKDVLFHDEHGGAKALSYVDLRAGADALADAFQREDATQLELAADRYVQLVLRYAAERLEVARSLMLSALFQLLAVLERRQPMRHDVRDRFARELAAGVEEATSSSRLLAAFNEALARLGFVASRAWQGPSVMRIEATLQHLRESFAEPLRLPAVARRAGFSVPAFARLFRQTTGTSFLVYLRALRVEHAKKLLVATPMTTDQVAQASGFQSQHHLIRSFKKVTGETPGAYRRAHGGADAGEPGE
jgi:AraC-like DNA-binding protein